MNDDEVKKVRRLTVDVENDKIALRKLKELALDLKVSHLVYRQYSLIMF